VLTGDEKLVSSGDSEEYSKRDPGEENREFFQGAVTQKYKAFQHVSLHHFVLGRIGSVADRATPIREARPIFD
jgi:hypothetical protein